MKNFLLTGVGGQGTVLAAKIIGRCALDKGMQVRTAETIGMAQRGGCVISHVRIGEEIYSPLVPLGTADLIIGFEPGEAARVTGYLKPGGAVITSSRAIHPAAALSPAAYNAQEALTYLKKKAGCLIIIDGEAVYQYLGTLKVLNMALLGAAAASGILGFTLDDLKEVIQKKLPPKFQDSNLAALMFGAKLAGSAVVK